MKREITPAQIKAVGKYESKNYDKILLRVKKDERAKYKAAADHAGLSLNAFIVQAINKMMEVE